MFLDNFFPNRFLKCYVPQFSIYFNQILGNDRKIIDKKDIVCLR